MKFQRHLLSYFSVGWFTWTDKQMGGGKTEISLTIEDALLKVTYQLCGVGWCCHHWWVEIPQDFSLCLCWLDLGFLHQRLEW